jgi:diguanylate cyclase (GGDEF)-like protein
MPAMKIGANGSATVTADDETDSLVERVRGLRHSDPVRALELAQANLASARQAPDARRTATCLLLCAELHFDLSDFDRAHADGTAALAGFEQVGDVIGRIDSHRALGRNHEKLGHDDQAQVHLRQALELSRRAGDDRRTGFALLSLGHVLHNIGDFSGTIPLYREALELALPLGDTHLQGMAESGLANAFARLGEFARALDYHQRCLQRFDEAQHPRERSYILNNIANVHHALDDHRQAVAFHEQSLDLKRRLKDRWGEGTSLYSLGTCYAALREFERAQACFEASLSIAQAIGDREGECVNQHSLGDLAMQRGQLDEALRCFEASLRLCSELGGRYNQAMLLYGKGKALRLKAELPMARDCLEHALKLANERQTRRDTQRIHDELAVLFEANGDPARALGHLKQAYGLEREIFNEDLESRLRHLKLNAELEQAEREKELHRQRQLELAQMNQALERSNVELAQANAHKEKLLSVLDRQKRQLQRQSTQDVLTGLANRRLFDQELARAFRSSKRYGQPLSVVICDIDNFKSINDRFSHQTGDAVLKAIARLLVKHGRRSDLVARYGGEEFALLLSNTPGDHAFAVCEKIRGVIADHPWGTVHPDLAVTLSMGIADDLSPESHDRLMAQADRCLYRAKHAGKNQVVMGG